MTASLLKKYILFITIIIIIITLSIVVYISTSIIPKKECNIDRLKGNTPINFTEEHYPSLQNVEHFILLLDKLDFYIDQKDTSTFGFIGENNIEKKLLLNDIVNNHINNHKLKEEIINHYYSLSFLGFSISISTFIIEVV